MNEFEQKLSRQPLREIPSEWRAQILAVAKPASNPASDASFLSTISHQFSTLLWPHPKAWAGLAAIWIFIFALNFSMRDSAPRVAKKSAPPSPEVVVELKKEQKLFAELMGANNSPDADRPKIFLPRPRTERIEILTT